ncbi:MAG TPA: GNAT family N-acetyltransferase [Caulobacteraceae bacterium]|jgi:GNAT superfamily N-acetyltransferase|nr:GNAT family N-acetyltransferase [Caulobacteraceae bacterium]
MAEVSSDIERPEQVVRPVTPELWPALEDLFGKKGACNGCWCMFWRIGAAYNKRPRDENKADFRRIVEAGPPPGLLAFEGGLAVGWCQITPRAHLPWMDHGRVLRRVDDAPVWSISCFYVRSGYRRKGVTAALIDAAVEIAAKAGAPAVEAIPVDKALPKGVSNDFTGVASTFRRLGFEEVARRSPARPIMRKALAPAAE